MIHITIPSECTDTFLQTKYPRLIQKHLEKQYQDFLKQKYQVFLKHKYEDFLENMYQDLLKKNKQQLFEKEMKKFLDKKYKDYLEKKDQEYDPSSDIENSPYYIYKYLIDFTAKKLLSISLSEMNEVINEIQKIPGWSWLRDNNYNENIWKMCKSCKLNNKCKIGQPHIIYEELKEYFGNKYKEWIGEKIEDEEKEEEDKEDKQEKKIEKVFTPYEFIKSLHIKACPYCNLEYAQTTTVNLDNGKDKFLRPALDHFYPKSKYPFFALSLNNLVPTCTTCNSSIKGDDDSIKSYKGIIHPYDEKGINYSDCVKYRFTYIPFSALVKFFDEYDENLTKLENELKKSPEKLTEKYHGLFVDKKSHLGISLQKFFDEYIEHWKSDVEQWKKDIEQWESDVKQGRTPKKTFKMSLENNAIILVDCMPFNNENDEYYRAKYMFDYFAIKPRLEQGHNDYIREIAIKAMEYPQEYIEKLQSKGYLPYESLRIFFGNYVEPKDFNQRPLSKITHDVIEQIRPDILKELEKKNQSQNI